MAKNVCGQECTQEYCHRWGYQCESVHPHCWESQSWNQEAVRLGKEKDETARDERDICRLKQRGYRIQE